MRKTCKTGVWGSENKVEEVAWSGTPKDKPRKERWRPEQRAHHIRESEEEETAEDSVKGRQFGG